MLGIAVVLVIGAVAVAIGIGFGIVIAPRIGRLLERAEPDTHAIEDEEPRDRTD
jgi:Na+/H+-dicarboxylate symporter